MEDEERSPDVPPNAQLLPPSLGPFGNQPQMQQLAQLLSMVEASNEGLLDSYNGKCATWLVNAGICRGLGIQPGPMPTQPISTVSNVSPTPPVYGGSIWYWETEGPLLGQPCPPLPPLPVPVPGTVAIGGPVGGNWFQVLATDTMPNQAIVVEKTAGATYPAGTYKKYVEPWGSLYLKTK